jgi:hypothetical protein
MTRLGSLVFCAMFFMGIAVHGCGSNTPAGGAGGAAGGAGAGGAGAGGTPSGTAAVEAIIPGDNTVAGWVRDPSVPLTANKVAAIATTQTDAVGFIDGGADPFYNPPTFAPAVFAWQNYMNSTVNSPDGYTLILYVLQMPSAAQATALYNSLVDGTHALYTSNTWTDMSPAIGDKARITNSGTDWWINFRKGAYYCQVRLTYAESTDSVGKQQTIDFATAVAAKM